MRLYTTHNLIKAASACEAGIDRFSLKQKLEWRGYGDDSILPLSLILEINGLDDALWALRAVPVDQTAERDRIARRFACACAERVASIDNTRARTAARATRKRIPYQAAIIASKAARKAADREPEADWQAERLMYYLKEKTYGTKT